MTPRPPPSARASQVDLLALSATAAKDYGKPLKKSYIDFMAKQGMPCSVLL
jgi:hypothetical protein